MSQYTIIVLAPNGRRQTVKVTSNTTVLQILEYVCSKQEFDPQEYDLRHHSRILDTTMTVEFSRLPNNAQLEMVKAKKLRKEEEVLVSLQIESGERLNGKFFPTENLWDVILKLKPPFDSSNQSSIQYMRQEIRGEETLRNTTLRSLGLTSGRALFRFMNRPAVENAAPAESHRASTSTSSPPSQQVVPRAQPKTSSSPPLHPSVNLRSDDRKSPEKEPEIMKSPPSPANTSPPPLKKPSPPLGRKSPSPQMNERFPNTSRAVPIAAPLSPDSSRSKKTNSLDQKILAEIRERKASARSSGVNSNTRPRGSVNESTNKSYNSKKDSVKASEGKPQEPLKKTLYQSPGTSTDANVTEEPSTSSLLGQTERNPVVYSRKMQRHESSEDLPDEFFELTIDDVKYLYRSLKSQSNNIDDSPLQTSALRKLEESKRVLNQLHKYKRAVLRIEFPDQNVLQGTFSSVETIENVYQFVREFLEDPTVPFYLYTTPPKDILPMSAKLIEANCVPCAVLHFGIHGSNHQDTHFLKQKVLSQLTSLEAASTVALRSRGLIQERPQDDSNVASTSEGAKERNENSGDTSNSEKCAKVSGNPNVTIPVQEIYR